MFYSANVSLIQLHLFILCTILFINVNCAIWTEHIPRNVTRFRRQATSACERNTDIQCDSGECIVEDKYCDGKDDCKDGSDETDACKAVPCSNPYLFKCDYGGCISKKFTCDGKQDCKDNSDEKNCTSTNPCGPEQFTCKNGECINDIVVCDGKAECSDNSDETEDTCKDLGCPTSTYRCDYGGCVSNAAKCNGIKDCFDGSDEKSCPTPEPQSPSTPGSCKLPANPENGFYKIGQDRPGTYAPGTYVQPYSAIILFCYRQHNPSPPGKNVSLCFNGQWSPPLATCAPSCRSVESTKTTIVTCTFKGMQLDSCLNPVEGVQAFIECEKLHEEPGLERYPFRKCKDGSWDNTFPQCYPICGQKRPKGVPNIIGGQVAKKGDYPWHVGIYRASDKSNICGGSIISDHVVISAAHCFSNPSNGQVYPSDKYLVAAGKYYREYFEEKDTEVQYSAVSDIFLPTRYKGEISHYEADISVVILTAKLNFSSSVQPVCVDWTTKFEYQQIFGKNHGVVVGWGQTKEGALPSEELKELSVPVITYDQCFEEVPKNFRRFLTHDKVCAGFLNTGHATCQGDSGGGLAFEHTNGRYYLRGIVSTSPATLEGFCNSDQYGTYTLVSEYVNFIQQHL